MKSIKEDYLTFQLVRLFRTEPWLNAGLGFSFVLAKGGKGQYTSKSTAQSLLPGDVLVLNSAAGGKIEAGGGDELVFWRFSVCLEHFFPLFAVEEISLLHDIIENFKGFKLYPAASPLAQECHRLVASAPPQGAVDHRSQVLRVAAAVLAEEFKHARGKRVGFIRMKDHMTQVLGELSTTELLTLSVGDMALKFSCSRRHLNRLFHQHFGCSVGTLRMEMRLLKALSLLRDPDVKIINVAEQCGFNHLGLFNICFKKRFGKTPGVWRKGASIGEEPVAELGGGDAMGVNGLWRWALKKEDHGAKPPTAPLPRDASVWSGPSNPDLAQTIMRNEREMRAPIKCKSSSGIKSRECP